jgi:hypothetical protein
MKWLRTSGPRVVTEDEEPVRLRGVGVSGWLNMENFITGYPATETAHRDATPGELDQRGFEHLDRAIDGCASQGIYTVTGDPYPFGARRYVTQLVLSICFAEPLSDEFAACFATAPDEELAALGECFAFRNCVPDEALCAVVESRQVRSG